MTWRRDKLPELVRAMSGRPRHEALRGHVTELLREGFGAPYDEIAHELYLLDNRGRIDTMWGATVIELKSDLRRELPDVRARMPDYLADAARRTHSPRPVTGIATDGATFIGYQLIDGALTELRRYETNPERPNELMAWLEPLLRGIVHRITEIAAQSPFRRLCVDLERKVNNFNIAAHRF